MKEKIQVFRETLPYLQEAYGDTAAQKILDAAHPIYDKLCAENPNESKAVQAHTRKVVYPTVALYRAMQDQGIPEALHFMDVTCSKRAEPKAASMRAMLKIPGLYLLMPRIFKFVTNQQFGTAAGFRATFYPVGNRRVKFDMTKCLYCDTCRRLGCPELTQCFCHTDDVTDGNMHPKLLWNRTKTMGEGGDVCDFDLIVQEAPEGNSHHSDL